MQTDQHSHGSGDLAWLFFFVVVERQRQLRTYGWSQKHVCGV